jgi:long-chain fatty acid transport protein
MSYHRSLPKLSLLALLVSQAFITAPAYAAGFVLNELSPGLFGEALAGSAAAKNDVSAMFINPATLGNLTSNQVYLGASIIFPNIELSDARARHTVNIPGLPPTSISANVFGDDDQNNIASSATVPVGYFGYRINEQLVAGLAIVAPYGLTTDYNEDSVLRFDALNSSVRTVDIVPTIAWAFNDHFMVGAGFQAQYMKAHFSQFNGPYTGTVIDDLIAAQQPTHLYGQDWGFGYTLGVLFNSDPCTRWGLSYRSSITENLEGSGQQFISPGPTVPAPSNHFPFNADSAVKGSTKTPGFLTFSAARDFATWTLKGTIQRNFWSVFDKLSINMPEAYATNFTIQTKWEDTWFASLGAEYRTNEHWTVRGGLAYDQTPTKDAYRDPRIPDNDRYWITLGTTYAYNQHFSIDGSYAHFFSPEQKVSVTQASGVSATSTVPLEVNTVSGKYNSYVDIIAVALRYSF